MNQTIAGQSLLILTLICFVPSVLAQNWVRIYKKGVSTATTYPLPLPSDYYRDLYQGRRYNPPEVIAKHKRGPELGDSYQVYTKQSILLTLQYYRGWLKQYGWKIEDEKKYKYPSGISYTLTISKSNEKGSIELSESNAAPPDRDACTIVVLSYPIK